MGRVPAKPLVFISHVADEKEVALALKEFIEKVFYGTIEVFVSSSPTSIRIGTEWLEKIKWALKACEIEIVVVGPASVRRPWINFEAGAVWSRGKPVIPLCHSGLTEGSLDYPLKMLQAGAATDEGKLKDILGLMIDTLGGALPTSIDYSFLIRRVRDFEDVSAQHKAVRQANPVAAKDGLAPHEFATLVSIAGASDPNDGIAVHQLREVGEAAGLSALASTLGYKMLLRKGLVETVEVSAWNNSYDAICLTAEGWEWLHNNRDTIDLEYKPVSAAQPEDRPEDDIPF
jgi:hypothetical protein